MTRRDDLESIRKTLEDRRRALMVAQRGMGHELDALKAADRDPEYEETAQVAQAEYTLATMQENHRREIEQIDAAMARLSDGSYGLCVDCDTEIPFERLMAVPFSLRCADCADAREQRLNRGGSPATM